MSNRLNFPFYVALDTDGDPISGAKLNFYESGTSTPLDTYSEETLTTPNTNPVVADSAGRFGDIFMKSQDYKVVLTDASDVTITTWDPVGPESVADFFQDITGGLQSTGSSGAYVVSTNQTIGSLAAGTRITFIANHASPGASTLKVDATDAKPLKKHHNLALIENDIEEDQIVDAAYKATEDVWQILSSAMPLDGFSDPAGRLTLTTATAITTADVTAATTLYFTPHKGDIISLYDGASWEPIRFTELSIAVPATTSTMYDVYVYNNSGTPTLELTAWTNDTTRATALVLQNGIYVKTGALTRRYVGSFRTTGVSGQTEDSLAKRYVWNYYNRSLRPMRVTDATNTWNYTTATIRQANGTATNQLDFVVGVAEDLVRAKVRASAVNATGGVSMLVGVGLDSTSAFTSGGLFPNATTTAASGTRGLFASYEAYIAAGRHFLSWNEYSAAAGTTTWTGDSGAPTIIQSGISGEIWG